MVLALSLILVFVLVLVFMLGIVPLTESPSVSGNDLRRRKMEVSFLFAMRVEPCYSATGGSEHERGQEQREEQCSLPRATRPVAFRQTHHRRWEYHPPSFRSKLKDSRGRGRGSYFALVCAGRNTNPA